MSTEGSGQRKRKRYIQISLDSLRRMSTAQLIQALEEEGVINAASSIGKHLSEQEIDGDLLINMCREGYKGLQSYGFKMGTAYRLERLYVRLLEEEKEKKRPKTSSIKLQQDPLQKYRDRLNAIKTVNITKAQLSDPKTQNWFPYPFLGVARPGGRFRFRENDEVYYEGRKEFGTILAKVRDLRLTGEAGGGVLCKELYLNGTWGYGKSHFLCAIAFWLLRAGERVVYLPEAKELIRAEVEYLRHALSLADAPMLEAIRLCRRVCGESRSVRYPKAAKARLTQENVAKLVFFGGLDEFQ
ncbi:hypothetical protein L211DRAFT_854350 [Terfezia boudieri ATCC MYA-4762]|uniref:Uncharacterized protein n=1 Tax=Terfezia boudieri ATCC MYA-4762 TaxID=1051890 RepID=A0A3N4L8V1_9PEZI|nr:hypothetical protein L211DRAFT_854350 [Terfezia boudieri ATCC MYA-4762]